VAGFLSLESSKTFHISNFIKNMKNTIFVIFALVAFIGTAFRPMVEDVYRVDAGASKLTWKGYKVTGEHAGTVNLQSGSLKMEAGKLVGGELVVDMNSMACTDLQGEWADKLMGHLKSPDFFNTASHPTSTLKIKKAIALDTKGNYKIVADLTVKTTTKEVKFNANVAEAAGIITTSGKVVIDRSDFDVRYGSGSFMDDLGDKTIYDEFDINFSVSAKK
jgi:polyisoprenoid-binding protein YceI